MMSWDENVLEFGL